MLGEGQNCGTIIVRIWPRHEQKRKQGLRGSIGGFISFVLVWHDGRCNSIYARVFIVEMEMHHDPLASASHASLVKQGISQRQLTLNWTRSLPSSLGVAGVTWHHGLWVAVSHSPSDPSEGSCMRPGARIQSYLGLACP